MHTAVVRGIVAALGLGVVSACVGTNPWWDEPIADETSAATTVATDDTDDGAPTGSDAGSTTEVALLEDTTAAVSPESTSTGRPDEDGDADDGSSSTSGLPELPTCEEDQAICAGECKNVDKDKHFCGVACVDCTVRFGNHATCEAGRCVPEDSKRD